MRDGKLCYYIDDGVYHTFSRRHLRPLPVPPQGFKNGPTQICSVFGPTCDALDTISPGRAAARTSNSATCVYSENIGAYSHASSTWFNGFPPAKVVHVNQTSSADETIRAAS